jgi:hypothetical protein
MLRRMINSVHKSSLSGTGTQLLSQQDTPYGRIDLKPQQAEPQPQTRVLLESRHRSKKLDVSGSFQKKTVLPTTLSKVSTQTWYAPASPKSKIPACIA